MNEYGTNQPTKDLKTDTCVKAQVDVLRSALTTSLGLVTDT